MTNCQCGCGNVVFVSHDCDGNTCIHTRRPTTGEGNKSLLLAQIRTDQPIECQIEMTQEEKVSFATKLLDGIAEVVPV